MQLTRMLKSRLCTQDQFSTAEYRDWCGRIHEPPRLHRKQWEFCYIAQALFERGLLQVGRSGLGFGVGQEPLPALFASLGCSVVATDQDDAAARQAGWVDSGQHADGLANLNTRGLCSDEQFNRLVSFRTVDMNAIPPDLAGFDFVWSSCSLEHLGSIDLGNRFILRAMDCLRPGGVAVHTTEFNVASNFYTMSSGGTVLFRRTDVEAVVGRLTDAGYRIELDFDLGSGEADHYVDDPPYKSEPHLKLAIGNYVSTSIGLIIEKQR
jgi:hypothetical protein